VALDPRSAKGQLLPAEARRQAAQASGFGCPSEVFALVFGNIALNSDLRGGHTGIHLSHSDLLPTAIFLRKPATKPLHERIGS
jgi:hypothetical protein